MTNELEFCYICGRWVRAEEYEAHYKECLRRAEEEIERIKSVMETAKDVPADFAASFKEAKVIGMRHFLFVFEPVMFSDIILGRAQKFFRELGYRLYAWRVEATIGSLPPKLLEVAPAHVLFPPPAHLKVSMWIES